MSKRWVIGASAVLGLIALIFLAQGPAGAGGDPIRATLPRPLDPLGGIEQAHAVQIALDEPAVVELIGSERYRVIGASLRIEKELVFTGARLADVHIYRYGSNDVVWPIVDLMAQSVREVDAHLFQPALTAMEVQEAEPVILSDPRVLERLGEPAGVSIRAGLRNTDEGPCAVDRCILVMFFRAGEPVSGLFARYDLSAQAVDAVGSLQKVG